MISEEFKIQYFRRLPRSLWMPRNVQVIKYGMKNLISVCCLKKLLEYMKKYDVIIGLYPDKYWRQGIIDTVMIELDGETFEENIKDVRSIDSYLKEKYDFRVSKVYLSGKGMHVYIDFYATNVGDIVEIYRQIYEELEKVASNIDFRYLSVAGYDIPAGKPNYKHKGDITKFPMVRIDFTKDTLQEALMNRIWIYNEKRLWVV